MKYYSKSKQQINLLVEFLKFCSNRYKLSVIANANHFFKNLTDRQGQKNF